MYIQATDGKFYQKPIFTRGDVEVLGNMVRVPSVGLMIGAARKRCIEALGLLGIPAKVDVHGSKVKTFVMERLADAYEFEWRPIGPIPVPLVCEGMVTSSVPMDVPHVCFWYYFPYKEIMDVIAGMRISRRMESLWANGTRNFKTWLQRQVDYHAEIHGIPKAPMISIYIRAYGYKGDVGSPAFM